MKLANAALAYRESASIGASPVGLVVLLYDRLLQDIHNAVAALEAHDVEARSNQINHALLVLQQLQGTLDLEAGGEASRQLDAFYGVLRGKLLEGQIRQSADLLLQQAHAVAQVREAWARIDGPLPDMDDRAGGKGVMAEQPAMSGIRA